MLKKEQKQLFDDYRAHSMIAKRKISEILLDIGNTNGFKEWDHDDQSLTFWPTSSAYAIHIRVENIDAPYVELIEPNEGDGSYHQVLWHKFEDMRTEEWTIEKAVRRGVNYVNDILSEEVRKNLILGYDLDNWNKGLAYLKAEGGKHE